MSVGSNVIVVYGGVVSSPRQVNRIVVDEMPTFCILKDPPIGTQNRSLVIPPEFKSMLLIAPEIAEQGLGGLAVPQVDVGKSESYTPHKSKKALVAKPANSIPQQQ